MTSSASYRGPRVAPFVAALTLLGAMIFAPAVAADTTGSVSVSASVASELSFTLCDTDADFGDGLSSRGTPPTGTTDAVGVTHPSTTPGGSVYYHWTPSCQAAVPATGRFFHVVSSSSWRLTPCASENAGAGASPTLRIANSDLRWVANISVPFTNYVNAHAAPAFFLCGAPNPPTLNGLSGTLDIHGHYYLQLQPTDQPGSFTTTTTWTLTPE